MQPHRKCVPSMWIDKPRPATVPWPATCPNRTESIWQPLSPPPDYGIAKPEVQYCCDRARTISQRLAHSGRQPEAPPARLQRQRYQHPVAPVVLSSRRWTASLPNPWQYVPPPAPNWLQPFFDCRNSSRSFFAYVCASHRWWCQSLQSPYPVSPGRDDRLPPFAHPTASCLRWSSS